MHRLIFVRVISAHIIRLLPHHKVAVGHRAADRKVVGRRAVVAAEADPDRVVRRAAGHKVVADMAAEEPVAADMAAAWADPDKAGRRAAVEPDRVAVAAAAGHKAAA